MDYKIIFEQLRENGSSSAIEDDFEKIIAYSDTLSDKLYKNKLKKEDREMLEDALQILYALRKLC